ncbi:MAG: ATP-binding protein [Actinomycetota bacterium]|nr:ATP-binding protein [Actinomycetota bacterium]
MSGGIGTARTAPASCGVDLAPAWPDFTSWFALAARPEAVADARSFTNSMLGAWDVDDDAADNTALVVSELVTNAIQATLPGSSARVWLRLRHRAGLVAVEVADNSPASPAPGPPPDGDDEHGRGLLIVEALCEQWGCYQLSGAGKVVMAMLRTRTAGGMTGSILAVPAAGPAVRAPAPVPADAALICEAIGDTYPDWVVWWCRGMFYARRSGSFREIAGDKGRYLIMHAHPAVLLIVLEEEDQIRDRGRWDAPARGKPGPDRLRSAGRAVAADPMDLARDMIAAGIEDEWPGWSVDHGLMGWTAAWLADPTIQVHAESHVALKASLPALGKPPPGAG